MKANNLIIAAVVSGGLAVTAVAKANEKGEKEESISSSAVPAAVQQAAQAEAKGGTVIRWEKEGSNYEAVIQHGAKQTGIEITADGKVVSRHDESQEHKEKGQKH